MNTLLVPVIEYQTCTGCLACVELFPEGFELRGDKVWVRFTRELSRYDLDRVVMLCPVRAIGIGEI